MKLIFTSVIVIFVKIPVSLFIPKKNFLQFIVLSAFGLMIMTL